MEKKVIIKELHKPVREMEIDVKDDLFMEDAMAPLMERPKDVAFISLNRLNTMYLVVNGMSGIDLEDNFLYVENDGVQKDGLIPQVKPARGTAYFVRVEWVQDGYKKKPKLRNVTEDDFIYARNFMTDLYQRKLKETTYPMLFS
ncbi:MAG: hypothetical protein E7295_09060 [Lachnospiraceae bacterium]|nr:hypothetical protein [Lachnospiraceae bacterium]